MEVWKSAWLVQSATPSSKKNRENTEKSHETNWASGDNPTWCIPNWPRQCCTVSYSPDSDLSVEILQTQASHLSWESWIFLSLNLLKKTVWNSWKSWNCIKKWGDIDIDPVHCRVMPVKNCNHSVQFSPGCGDPVLGAVSGQPNVKRYVINCTICCSLVIFSRAESCKLSWYLNLFCCPEKKLEWESCKYSVCWRSNDAGSWEFSELYYRCNRMLADLLNANDVVIRPLLLPKRHIFFKETSRLNAPRPPVADDRRRLQKLPVFLYNSAPESKELLSEFKDKVYIYIYI